jgi:hypothetical protein
MKRMIALTGFVLGCVGCSSSSSQSSGDQVTPDAGLVTRTPFIVPFVPEAIIYGVPGDESSVSYGPGASVGTATVWTDTTTLSEDVSVGEASGELTGDGVAFSASSVTSNGVSQNFTYSSSLSVGFSDKTLDPKHDLYFLAMNVPGTKTDRENDPPHFDIALEKGTLILLSAEQLQNLAQSPPDLSLFLPGQLEPSYVGSTSATLSDLIEPQDAQALLAMDPQIQGEDFTQNPDRFVRAQLPNPAGSGAPIPATVPLLAAPSSQTIPSNTVTVEVDSASIGAQGQTDGAFEDPIGIHIGAAEASLVDGGTDGFFVSFSKRTTTATSTSFTASVTLSTDDRCTSGTVDLFLDRLFGTYISVPHLTGPCAP